MSHSVLVLGDLHIHDKTMVEGNILVSKVLNMISNNSYDFIVILGDILHSHETIKMFPYNLAINFLKSVAKLLPTYLLLGNHDIVNNSVFQPDIHPFIALIDYPNLTIINKAKYIQIKNQFYYMLPYVSPGRFYEALLTSSKDEIELLERFKTTTAIFAHQEFRNCQMGAIKSTKGDIWGLDKPLVISGHIHGYEILQPNIIYVGTPYQTTFDDSIDKTVSHFTFNGKEFKEERIDLKISKKKIMKINVNELEDFKIPEDLMIKLKITGTDAEIKAVMKNTKIKELEKQGVLISYNTLISKKSFAPVEHKELSYVPRLQKTIACHPRLSDLLQKLL